MCFQITVSSATCSFRNRYIVSIKRVYTDGTVFMKPAVDGYNDVDFIKAFDVDLK